MATQDHLPQAQPAPLNSALAPMLRKLELWKTFAEEERAALLALPHEVVEANADSCLVREGEGRCP